MTPKEKAYDIVRKIGSATLFTRFNGGNTIEKEEAKLYALICIDEIMQSTDAILHTPIKEYWEQVKQEIENL